MEKFLRSKQLTCKVTYEIPLILETFCIDNVQNYVRQEDLEKKTIFFSFLNSGEKIFYK